MPFGSVNAPATFERLMERVLRGFAWTECLVYLDDILVFGPDFASTLERLVRVLDRLGGNSFSQAYCVGRREICTRYDHLSDCVPTTEDTSKASPRWQPPCMSWPRRGRVDSAKGRGFQATENRPDECASAGLPKRRGPMVTIWTRTPVM